MDNITIKKSGRYIHVLDSEGDRLSTFSFNSFKMWGVTKYFDTLEQELRKYLAQDVNSLNIRMYHPSVNGKGSKISGKVNVIKRIGEYIYSEGEISITQNSKVKNIKINRFLYNDNGKLKEVPDKDRLSVHNLFQGD